VGASGDLVQLAHLALGLLGEGDFWWNGQCVPAQTVFKELGLQTMNIHIREGIALMNGTSAMTGLSLLNLLAAKRIVLLTTLLSTLINEIMEAYDDHFSLLLNNAKLHEGQRTVARWMRNLSSSGSLLRNRAQHLYSALPTDAVVKDQVQEVYSVRCVPQIVGAVLDTLATAEKVVVNELNSVNDNPVIDAVNEQVLHGGNFHGDYISLEMDKLKLAMAKVSMLAERQLNFLLNPAINKKLPAFLNAGKPGLNFGMQGMQYTATSNVAENQALATSLYLHSIPSNNDNQDIVSMGTNAATLCGKVMDNTWEVLTIEALAVVNAMDILGSTSQISDAGKWLHALARELFPYNDGDNSPSARLIQLKEKLMQTNFEQLFNNTWNHEG
jgi:histidine ammonia-lyase